MAARLSQFANALLPMLLTAFGMVMFFMAEQPSNRESGILVTFSPMVMVANFVHPEKGQVIFMQLPALNSTEVKLLQLVNA